MNRYTPTPTCRMCIRARLITPMINRNGITYCPICDRAPTPPKR